MPRKSSINKDAGSYLLPPVGAMLALSGGGVKGVMQLKMLAEMESKTGMPVCKMFPTITGTSVGGLIAVLLTIPKEPGSTEPLFSAQQALEIFKNSAASIFPESWYHVGKIGQIFSHKYSQKPLKALLDKYLGDMELGDLLGRVLITTFDVSGKDSIKIFDSYNSSSVKAKDVVLATTAAPTYFKSVKFEDENGVSRVLVDGGIGYNRPAAEAIKYLKEGLTRDQQGEMLDNMMLVSLNFESPNEEKKILPPHLDGMLPQLANGLVSNIMKAAQKAATEEVKRDLAEDGQFVEFSLPVPKGSTKLDNSKPENMAKLKKVAEQYVENNKELIEKLCTTLVKNVNAREESSKLHEQQTNVEESSDSSVVSKSVISEEFEAKLAINLSEQQVETLQEGLMKLTTKEYDVLQVFLKGLNDVQLVALSEHLPAIADGNFKNTNIPELGSFQNKFLKLFSSTFEHESNIVEDALNCAEEYRLEHPEVPCDGRGSDSSHYVDAVY